MAEQKEIKYDLDGYDIITNALMALLNQYPDLGSDEIRFSTFATESGIAMFPSLGAVVESERRSITGYVYQSCNYPFNLVYKIAGVSERNKIKVKDFLDRLGRWLEKQMVTIGTQEYKLEAYPTLTDNREITSISRTTPAYLESIEENKVENWVISMILRYKNEYQL